MIETLQVPIPIGVNLRWDEEYGTYFRYEDRINEAQNQRLQDE